MNRSYKASYVSALLGVAGVALLIVACSTRDGFVKSDGGFDLDATVPDTCGRRCSRDLKQVLTGCDGVEQVVKQCNADQGCGGGACVDACRAVELTVNKGSAGCDFWTVPPDNKIDLIGGCFAAMIANTWDRAVSITAEFGDSKLDVSKSTYTVDRIGTDAVYTQLTGPLQPGQVAIVFFADNVANDGMNSPRCPPTITPARLEPPTIFGTGKAKAYHIKTDAPVSAYSIYPYGGSSSQIPSATLLLPVSSWTKNYVAVSPFDFENTGRRRSLQIIANEDGTEVSMRPTVQIAAGGGVTGTASGVAQTWTLSKGQVLQFLQPALTGSPIETNKPVGVFGGSECAELPTEYCRTIKEGGQMPFICYCDTLQQQIPPFEQWGTEYAVVPFQPRLNSFSPDVREQVPYTIVGAADGTNLTYEPSRPLNAPETLGAGQSASFITDQLFVVKSQDSKHPFHVNVYMTSMTVSGETGGPTTGDPDFVNVPPADQYLDRYVFFTDFTYPETTLTVVRRKTANGFVPVELECGGPITNFAPLGSSGLYEYAWVKMTSSFLPQKFAKGECSYGRQEAHSTGPFALTVWGTGVTASYGYVGGTGLRPINDAPFPPVH